MKFCSFFCTLLISISIQASPTIELKSVELSKAFAKVQTQKKISPIAIAEAFQFLDQNHVKHKLKTDYMAVIDFTLNSLMKRLALINLKTGEVEYYKVSHGKGSDKNHDRIMDLASDAVGSNATPLGFHRMGETYNGQHGLSLKMHGLEDRNKNSLKRYIVMHGAKYVSWKNPGRSLGCPAVEYKYSKEIIEKLKNGSLIYHYWNKTK